MTPDWVCEVLSPGTAYRDLGHRRRVYHAAKVGHYWLVDAEREEVTVLRWTLEGYVVHEIEIVDGSFRAPPFEAVAIELASLFGKA